jgi:ATP-dependent DNA helicase RecG
MTATPIPRTLTLTVYGDLDVSVIDELPPGRGKINTYVRQSKKHLSDSVKFLKTKLGEGRQAYIVYPLIEDSEKIKVGSVEGEFQNWSENLSPFKCELLHGRIAPDEKDSIMDRFRDGAIHVLISTTVIEVGVDVPNATIMYVFDAERFGLAQLHQLRGRIGRGKHNSYCVLMTDKVTDDSKQKLKALEESSDGFVIAETDLKLRGPGELLGKAQSGIDRLKLGDLITETELVKQSRSLSSALIKLDPNIENPENLHLRTLIMLDDDNDGVVA